MSTQTDTTNESGSPLVGAVMLLAAAVVGIFVLHWLSAALSDWLSWPLIVIGAVVFIAGIVTDNDVAKKGGFIAALIGLVLIVLDVASGFVITMLKAVGIIVLIFAIGIGYMVLRKRSS